MKKLYIIPILIMFVINLQAQFLMKSNTHILRAGDEHYFNITNNVGPGEGGDSKIWDFSKLENKSTLTSYMYSAFTTPNSNDIPEANAILEEYETKFYFKVTDNIIEQYGTVSKNNTITKYDKPFVKMVFPFNYGDTYSGDFSGTIEGQNNYNASFSGTYQLDADAYGTLILPGNITHKNVIRIKTTKEQCYKGNSCNCKTVSYKWYIPNVRYPVLTIIQSQTAKQTKTIRTAYYPKVKNTIENNSNNELLFAENIKANIYPNPFLREFKLDYTLNKNSNVIIEIYHYCPVINQTMSTDYNRK